MTLSDRLLGRLARQASARRRDTAIATTLPDTPKQAGTKHGLLTGIAGAVVVRVATRSILGAVVVTSGLVAKKLYDRRKARRAKPDIAGQKGTPDT